MQAELRVRILIHYYGRRRLRFFAEYGQFDEWVCIAPEEGKFTYELQGVKGVGGFGDILICPPGVRLRRRVLDDLTHHVIYFQWLDEGGKLMHPTASTLAGLHRIKDLARLSSNYAYLQSLEGRDEDWATAVRNHLVNDIFLLCGEELAAAEGDPEISQRTDDELMVRAQRYLMQHLGEKVSLYTLASSLGLSPVQFTRRFEAAYESTPIAYLTSVRLQHARSLLRETNLTIDEIGHQCGYSSGLYLSRIFVREVKVRPGKFRKMQRI